MNKILAIASNTFKEAIRDKLLYAILFFVLLLLLASLALGELSLGQQVRVTTDLGLSSISFFGILVAIFTGVNLVHKEIDKRTLYPLLAKPIQRYQFILGKYLGMLSTAFVQVCLLTLLFTGLLLYERAPPGLDLYQAIFLSWMEITLLTSVAIFFSSFTTPFFSGLFTFCFFIIGRLMPDIELLSNRLTNVFLKALLYLATLLPNLQYLNIGPKVIHSEIIPTSYLLSTSLYAMLYTFLFLLCAIGLFSRRDFI